MAKFKEGEKAIWMGDLVEILFPCNLTYHNNNGQMYMAKGIPIKIFNKEIGMVVTNSVEGYPEEDELVKIKHQECAGAEWIEALKNGKWYYKVAEQGNACGHKRHFKTEKSAKAYIKRNDINLARTEKHFSL
jgi:hypothetical protein